MNRWRQSILKENYGLDFFYRKPSVPYRILWFLISKNLIFVLLIGILIILFLAFFITDINFCNCREIIIKMMKGFLHKCDGGLQIVLRNIWNRVLMSWEFFWDLKSTILSISFTAISITLTITSFVFDGKTIAGTKKDVINNICDNRFLHRNKWLLIICQILIVLSIIFKYESILTTAFLIMAFLIAVQLQLCLCYTISKTSMIYKFSNDILYSVIETLKSILEYPRNIFTKKIPRFSVLVDSICAPVSSEQVSERLESQQLILYIISHLTRAHISLVRRNSNECFTIKYNHTNKILRKFVNKYDDSALLYPAYIMFYNYYSKVNLNESDSTITFLENAMLLTVDSAFCSFYCRYKCINVANKKVYHTQLRRIFFVLSGLILGALDAGVSTSVLPDAISRLQKRFCFHHQQLNKEFTMNGVMQKEWIAYVQGLAAIIIIWNESKIVDEKYLITFSKYDYKKWKEYKDALVFLFNALSPYPRHLFEKNVGNCSMFTSNRMPPIKNASLSDNNVCSFIKSVMYWWKLSTNAATIFPYTNSRFDSVHSKCHKLFGVLNLIQEFQKNTTIFLQSNCKKIAGKGLCTMMIINEDRKEADL